MENAIISGDALLIKAFELLERYETISLIDKKRLCRLIRNGCGFGLAAALGQVTEFQMQHEGDYKLRHYLRMVRLKTASLVEAATEAGGIIGSANQTELEALNHYGRGLGIAFQVVDDSKDLLGSENKSSKTQYNDLRLAKPSPMLCHYLQRANEGDKQRLLHIIGNQDLSQAEIEEVVSLYRKYDSIQFSQRLVKRFVHRAKVALEPLSTSKAKDLLSDLTDIVGYWALPVQD